MSIQNDLLNGNNNKNESLANEGLEHAKMCSNWQDDSDNMFPYYEDDTRGDGSKPMSGRHVKVVKFSHLGEFYSFDREN